MRIKWKDNQGLEHLLVLSFEYGWQGLARRYHLGVAVVLVDGEGLELLHHRHHIRFLRHIHIFVRIRVEVLDVAEDLLEDGWEKEKG